MRRGSMLSLTSSSAPTPKKLRTERHLWDRILIRDMAAAATLHHPCYHTTREQPETRSRQTGMNRAFRIRDQEALTKGLLTASVTFSDQVLPWGSPHLEARSRT